MELNKYLEAGTDEVPNNLNKFLKLSHVGLTTKIEGGNLNNSSAGLKAVVKR